MGTRSADEATPRSTKLDNAKRERFAQEYLVDLNASQAAIRAGYSPRTAGVQGYALLKNPQVAARLQALRATIERKTGITIEKVLHELAVVGFASVEDVQVDDLGQLLPREGAPENATRAIASVKRTIRRESKGGGRSGIEPVTTETVTVEVRYWNKVEALKAIGEHLGMFPRRHELTGKDGEPLIPAGRLAPDEVTSRIRELLARN